MDGFIDLHVHTAASDGSMSPAELVRHAKNKGLSAVAITDHDTVDGIADSLNEGAKIGMDVVPGVEISADYENEMHILGYFFNGNYHGLASILTILRNSRRERNPKIVARLNEMGFDITVEEVGSIAGGDVVGRLHIAKALEKKGYVRNVQEAFDKYLSKGKHAYFKKEKLTPEQSIKEIIKAGGIPVLAHPLHMKLNMKQLDKLLSVLTEYGLKGIETYYVDNTPEDTGNTLRLALKWKLLVTGGSDFHGSFKPDVQIGIGRGNLRIPYEILERMRNNGI